MVEMAVGQKDRVHMKTLLRERFINLRAPVSRIDDDRFGEAVFSLLSFPV